MTFYVSTEPPCIFVKVFKTGSTTVRRGLFGAKLEAMPGSIPADMAHVKSFACIRHPYERMRSVIDHFRRHKLAVTDKERQLMHRLDAFRALAIVENESVPFVGDAYVNRLKKHALPMSHAFFGLDKVQVLFKADDFPKMWQDICEFIGIDPPPLPHMKRARDRTELSQAERRAVRDAFAADFERFGYQD